MHLTSTWLSAKGKEAEERIETLSSAQMELARQASAAAERAATAAEVQAIEARRANRSQPLRRNCDNIYNRTKNPVRRSTSL